MADIAKTTPAYGGGAAGVVVTWTAATTTDQEAAFDPGDILIARNTGASTRTVTVYSVANRAGRTGNIVDTLAVAPAARVYGPFTKEGWIQSNGKLRFKATHAEVEFAIIKARSSY